MRRLTRPLAVTCLSVVLVATSNAEAGDVQPAAAYPTGGDRPSTRSVAPTTSKPLTGRTIVVDPGHQLGNTRFPRKINRLVNAGGLRKPCNTTGTATTTGFPEATFTWRVAARLRNRLRDLGARVVMSRRTNRVHRWGPCVDVRGRLGNRNYRGRASAADLKISIHGDGAVRSGRGFHVIVSKHRGVVARSARFGRIVRASLQRAGFRRSTYTAAGRALVRRSDLGTLNLSRIPTAMVELGNMRNPTDARAMRTAAGQRRYAAALAAAARSALAPIRRAPLTRQERSRP